jgi:hypothetical protein
MKRGGIKVMLNRKRGRIRRRNGYKIKRTKQNRMRR